MAEPIRKSSNTEQTQRGHEAEMILSHPMVVDALDAIERKYMETWAASATEDVKVREFSYRMFRSAQLFRILLRKFIEDGTLVSHEVAEEERQTRSLED